MPSVDEIRKLLLVLDGKPADALESETLELKGWDPSSAARERQVRELRETVVCLANARGGTIVLGVADRKRTRDAAIHGVGGLDANILRRSVYEGTEPHILVEIEELVEPEGRLLLVRVPRGMPPHTTSEGVGKIRVDKECKPLTGSQLSRLLLASGQTDLTGQILPGTSLDDLVPEQVDSLRRTIETGPAGRPLALLPDEDLLGALDLIRDGELTLAAVLLLGRPPVIARFAPGHEVCFVRYRTATRVQDRRDLAGPLLEILERLRRILESHVRIAGVGTEGFEELSVPDLTWWAVREAILNALVHRDYFLSQSVHVELRPDRFEVSSPGGFIGGVTPENVLRHPPVRRNPLLASVCQTIGLVNRAGLGVDRMYEELLRLGKGCPRYTADEGHVRLTLPTRTHAPFLRFVASEKKEGRALDLDDLILIRTVATRGEADRWSAGRVLQLDEGTSAEKLVSLRRRGYLTPRGRGRGAAYVLARAFADLRKGLVETESDHPLDEEALLRRLESTLEERGRLTNEDVRGIASLSRTEALRLMRTLRDRGVAKLEGRGRGAHYVPGPALRGRGRRGGRTR